MSKTLGEIRIGNDLNTRIGGTVYEIKAKTAELINLVYSTIEPGERSEKARCINTSISKIEEASMWAVKAQFR